MGDIETKKAEIESLKSNSKLLLTSSTGWSMKLKETRGQIVT